MFPPPPSIREPSFTESLTFFLHSPPKKTPKPTVFLLCHNLAPLFRSHFTPPASPLPRHPLTIAIIVELFTWRRRKTKLFKVDLKCEAFPRAQMHTPIWRVVEPRGQQRMDNEWAKNNVERLSSYKYVLSRSFILCECVQVCTPYTLCTCIKVYTNDDRSCM